jgi:hypothetical protein
MSSEKLSSVGELRGDPMTTIDKDDTRLAAVLSLREIAACYRKFAEEGGNPTVWEARLRLAAKLEKEAAALEGSIGSAPVKRAQAAEGARPPG